MNRLQQAASRRGVLRFVVSLCLVSLPIAAAFADGASTSPVEVSQAWARATPPGAEVGGAYATFRNTSTKELRITGVSSAVSGSAEIHEMSMVDGVMRMRHLEDGLRLPPGATVSLKPGGDHIMLMTLKHPLKAGDAVALEFRVSDGETLKVSAPVREATP